jgi:hypothetical protein
LKNSGRWINYTIELLVVFLGVTAAFLLDSWRENQRDHQTEQQYLQSFRDDLSSDMKNLKTILPPNRQKLQRAQKFITTPVKIEPETVKVILQDMMAMEFFDKKQGTYESIKYSGSLNLISDYILKEQIVQYYENYKMVDKVEGIYQEWLNKYGIPFVYENMDIPAQKMLPLNGQGNHQFKNLVAGYYALLSQNINLYKEIIEAADSLIVRITKQQD